ncbi:MAG TPA: hypothetical protein VKG23_15100 [Thermoanaerobaculia bacterium]|nr:hypothetical protein [Thermoanaerobaculia bacterium]
MAATTRIPAGVRIFLALGLLAGASAPDVALAEDAFLLPPPASLASISFFVDRNLGTTLRGALEDAARRLSDSRCQEILNDFADGTGRPLAENLRAIGQSFPGYLGLVLFYDGTRTEACEGERVLAWTTPGNRAVHVCRDRFEYWQRTSPGYVAAIVIHESLHTLGLRESPPSPGEITAKVIERCGR